MISADSERGTSADNSCRGCGSRVSCAASVSRGDGPVNGDVPGHQLIGEQSDRVDAVSMRWSARRITRQLLGRHVRRSSDGNAGGGHATQRHSGTERLGDAPKSATSACEPCVRMLAGFRSR